MSTIDAVRRAFDVADTDKGRVHGYEYLYATIFSGMTPNKLLEIGVKDGASIAAWQILFPNCEIYGMDVEESKRPLNIKPYSFIKASSTTFDSSSLPTFDVIIDDGSHAPEDQMLTFTRFKSKFKYAYVIEDINLVKTPMKSAVESLEAIVAHVKSEGFKGVYSFDSLSVKYRAKAVVVLGNDF